jgi:hypothetical protein
MVLFQAPGSGSSLRFSCRASNFGLARDFSSALIFVRGQVHLPWFSLQEPVRAGDFQIPTRFLACEARTGGCFPLQIPVTFFFFWLDFRFGLVLSHRSTPLEHWFSHASLGATVDFLASESGWPASFSQCRWIRFLRQFRSSIDFVVLSSGLLHNHGCAQVAPFSFVFTVRATLSMCARDLLRARSARSFFDFPFSVFDLPLVFFVRAALWVIISRCFSGRQACLGFRCRIDFPVGSAPLGLPAPRKSAGRVFISWLLICAGLGFAQVALFLFLGF